MHSKRIRYSKLVHLLLISGAMIWANIEEASAQRRGGGGGGTRQSIGARGGGGGGAARAQSANRGGGQMAANRGGGQAAGNRGAQAPTGGAGADRANVGNVDRSRGDTDRSRGDIGSNNNINVDNDINIDADNGWGNDWDYHPVAAGVAFGTAAAITSAAIGSMYYSLPPSCAPRPYNSVSYYYCGNAWYMPQYSGTSVTYTVVNAPY